MGKFKKTGIHSRLGEQGPGGLYGDDHLPLPGAQGTVWISDAGGIGKKGLYLNLWTEERAAMGKSGAAGKWGREEKIYSPSYVLGSGKLPARYQ